MQEVFEKIINKTREKYNDTKVKLEKADLRLHIPILHAFQNEIIKEIRKVAAEYNNGWIPAEERLPEEHKLYDITFKNSAGIHSDSAIYNPYLKRWLWDADETELVEAKVLAWAEKREPYLSKGE